jgi:methionyl-tRNA formyltransferase
MTRAVVFAYHDVGCRCLAVLLAHDVEISLVVTHEDSADETIWFRDVATLARLHGLPVATPVEVGDASFVARVRALAPDFLFSFYYRRMLPVELLACARRGAFNMHGSLLPKYRGRAPVNWAVLHGERETGATLHEMVAKPDAGRIADQQAVPILPDDTASDVFAKVTVAAEMVLDRSLPALIASSLSLRPQDLAKGGYFGGRRPADGLIDWSKGAREVHNLVRAVAPPYPGAFAPMNGATLRVLRTLRTRRAGPAGAPALYEEAGELYIRCMDGGVLRLLAAELDNAPLRAQDFRLRFGTSTLPLAPYRP